ncbi:FG-GAP repeat domain-containing protein, partial [Streptosporangium sp. NPDC004379]|uniref:FG-GAP repeat domain-containing protein n=1 Tax=Streptosporangium sp. NPDC004379 TaxID=3366189 RepID=UPI0036930C89
YSTTQPVKIGNGWNGYSFFGATDWDRDGHQDLVVRENDTENLFLYPGESRRGPSGTPRVKIGNGWGGHTWFGATDWDRDGHRDLIARQDTTGDLLLYPGQSTRGYSTTQPVKIGNGW